jgi:hypothetical protein
MAVAYVNNATNTPVGTAVASINVTPTAPTAAYSSFVAVACTPTGNQLPTISVTDSLSGTWISIGSAITAPATTSNGVGVIVQYFFRTSAYGTTAPTITATFGTSAINAGIRHIYVTGWDGTTNPSIVGSSTGTTAPTAATFTAMAAGDLVFGANIVTGTAGVTVGTSSTNFTNIGSLGNSGSISTGRIFYSTVTGVASFTAGTYTGTATANSTSVIRIPGGVPSYATTGSASISITGTASTGFTYLFGGWGIPLV